MNPHRQTRRSILPAVTGAVALLAALAGPAGPAGADAADPTKAPAPASATTPTTAAARPVRGFTSVYVGSSIAPHTQSSATATCPVGTQVVGGAVTIASNGVFVNGSRPTGARSWVVYLNNTTDNTVQDSRVAAICGKNIVGYQRVTGQAVDNPPDTQTTATATCPSGTVALGGGGVGSAFSEQVNLNTDVPTATGWRVDVNNNTTGSDTATAYVVCASAPARYRQVFHAGGTQVDPTPGVNGGDNVDCPTGTAALSGGGFSSSLRRDVNLAQLAPLHTDNVTWNAQAVGAPVATRMTAYAVCAKTLS